MNIERALAEHLPREIEEVEADIRRREAELAERRVRLAKLYRIAAAAEIVLDADAPPQDIPAARAA
jgi:hypothetical protein